MVGVFNNSGRKGAGEEALALAIAKGGKTLDCVEGFLSRYYDSFGFVEKKRIPWDDNKAPKGWDYEKYGRRDIVSFEFPEDFSRDPADTARRLGLARSEGGLARTGKLWDHDRWLQSLLKSKGRDWIIKHRKGLVEELNMVVNLYRNPPESPKNLKDKIQNH